MHENRKKTKRSQTETRKKCKIKSGMHKFSFRNRFIAHIFSLQLSEKKKKHENSKK